MRTRYIRASVLSALLGLSIPALHAQAWDAAMQAQSWAKQDKDDSFTFFDPQARTLYTWTRDGGVMGSVPLTKLEEAPQRWLMDPRNNAWVAHGTTMSLVDRAGKVLASFKLPAEVGDACWDPKGFVISYRSYEPYVEKRDYKGGLLWSFGAKPGSRGDGPAPLNRRPVVLDDAGNVLMADGNSLNLSVLESGTGRKLSETSLRLPGKQPAPALEGPATERSAVAVWATKGVVFASVKASQIPEPLRGAIQGLALARIDLGQSTVEFLPTGLDESHILVGVLDADAIFVKPTGGLMMVKVK